jgi:thymidylate synthase (FAD)
MNVIYNPTVHVVGRQVTDETQIGNFLNQHDVVGWKTDTEVGGEKLSEVAGRTCYMSFGKPRPGGNKAYLDHIKASGHGSVLEHPVWNFIFTGVSRSLTHELVRHRAGFAYSQLSQRYVDESVCDVVCPPELADEVEQAWAMLTKMDIPIDMEAVNDAIDSFPPRPILIGLMWLRSMIQTNEDYKLLSDYVYNRLREEHTARQEANPEPGQKWVTVSKEDDTAMRKAARGTARSVLPNATETKIYVTANARAIRHFLEQRGSKFADVEIRKLAYAVLSCMRKEAPNLFGDYIATELPDGTLEITTPYKKV